jgi:uncharacterized repeat protein (TIGR01451 family)
MRKNTANLGGVTMLFTHHWISEARLRSLLSLMFSAMLIMSNATPFVQVASAASGDFSIDFIAAAPQSYNHLTGGGAYDDRTIGVGNDVVESLEGGDFSCGDIVTFFATVKVDDTQSAINDGPQTIEMDFSFLADSTGQSGAAFGDIVNVKVNYNTIEDLIPDENNIDDGIKDDGGSVAALTSETLTGPLFTPKSELHGTVKLDDIETGEQVVVRIDVELFCKPGSTPTGNLQADLTDARLTFINGNTPATGAISGGAQTIPLKQINDLRTPELDIQKTVTTADGTCPGVETLTVTTGNTVKYCYMVSNPGDAPLYNVNVIDDAGTPSNQTDDFTVTLSSGLTDIDGDGDADDLAAGGIATGTAMVTLSTTGAIVNTATAEGDDSFIEPTQLTDNDIATVIVEGIPSYTINKTIEGVKNPDNSPDADGIVDEAGDIIHYKIVVNNNGSSHLTGVIVTDPLLGALAGPTGDNAPMGILDAGEIWTYTGDYTVTQEDINNNGIAADSSPDNDGDIDNTATVVCSELDPLDDSEAAPIEQKASYVIDKTITDVAGKGPEGNVTGAGDVIAYQITVTNDGNIDLTNVTVTDPLLGTMTGPMGDDIAPGILNVGEIWTYTGSYAVTQADLESNATLEPDNIEKGFIDNKVTVTTTEVPTPRTDTEQVPVDLNPAYAIDKTVVGVDIDGDGIINNAGEVINYQITVTNKGNIKLTNITLVDTLITAANITGPTGDNAPTEVLNVGESWIFTGSYTVTQEDINTNGEGDGFINNTATVDCAELDQISDSEVVPITQKLAYTIDKTITDIDGEGPEASVNEAGDVITYQITVNNAGNVDLTNVIVTDSLITLAGPVESLNTDGILEVGETWAYTGIYIVTWEDINSNGDGDGVIENEATVDCDQLKPESDTAEAPIEQNAAYIIDKTITDVAGKGPLSSVTKAGDVIAYQITVTNDGNIDLTNVIVTDPLITLAGPVESLNTDGILEVGETWIYTGIYIVTWEDITTNGGGNGFINNTATVDSDQLGPESDSAAAPIEIIPVYEPNPAYKIEKCITDVDCRGPAASVKEAGDVITYRITVTNTGDICLTNVIVTDSLIALTGPVEPKNKDGILEVGETWTYTGKYTVTREDIDTNGGCDGYIDNVAIVDCDQLGPKSDSARAPIEAPPVFEACPEYRIEKCVTDVDCRGPTASVKEVGDVIAYRITVTNTGNVDLTNVVVTDPLIKTLKGPAESKDADGILDIGEKWTCTGSYVVTQEDIDTNSGCDGYINTVAMVNCDIDTSNECDGYIDNVATVDCDQLDPKSDSVRVMIEKVSTGEESTEEDSTEEDPIEEVPTEKKQDYCIYKSIIGVDQAGDCIINKPGDIIEYQIVVKNEGNADLTGVSVSDPMITLTGPTGDNINPGVLNPGETWKFVGNYTVTQTDINSNGGEDGFIDNTATVSCNELPDESSSVKQPIVLTSADDHNSDGGSNSNGGNGGTGSVRVISNPAKNVEVNGNTAGETGTEILLEPEIKSFEQNTGNAEANIEKESEQKESTGIPGFLIYGIIGLLAILLLIFLHKRK